MNNQDIYSTIIREKGKYVGSLPGTSMWPSIKDKEDTVVIVPVNRKLKKYDVILYKRDDGHYVFHRILKVNKDSYDLCGDNQWTIEKGIRFDQIEGVMYGIFKGDKLVLCSSRKNMLFVRFWSVSLFLRKIYIKVYWKMKKIFKKERK